MPVAGKAEQVFHPALQLTRQRQGNLCGRDCLPCLDQTQRLSTDTDGLGQVPLLHLQSLPCGLDGGSKPSIHGRSIPEPDRDVNLRRLEDGKVYQ